MLNTLFNLCLICLICIANLAYPSYIHDLSLPSFKIDKEESTKTSTEVTQPIEGTRLEEVYTKDLPSYIKPVWKKDSAQLPVTLFLPTVSRKNLFPTTKYIPNTNTPVTSTIDFLKTYVNIPKINSLKIKNKVLLLDFSSKNNFSEYNSEILRVLVNTLTSIDGVDGVLFLVDGKKTDNLLGNKDTTNVFYNDYPYAYLSYDYNGRNLLVPTTVHDVNQVIKVLKSDKDELQGVIPKGVELIDYYITKDTLTLNFNENFLKAYKDRPDLKNMLINSLNYSYTSFEKINNLEIKVDGEKISTFGDYDLSTPMKSLKIINP
ncbi:GerMN domain-containing protein [Anaeromicrobium sediminis]|uniref:GerMN domain-containing protein n=1 Tax=Anaeromicrobium sediminis TaxID=1478221 RepID=A0A267MFC2_9FIRM|nr:GerMN domain-containing protein [Anaeromicrobium sediminis]PAB58157.1 hypothetical protein CCE28_16925 [Anaeromicrobium sediminis]